LRHKDPVKAGGKALILNSVSLLRTGMLSIHKSRAFMPILLASERVENGEYRANRTAEEVYRSAGGLLEAARRPTGGFPTTR